MEEKNEKRIIPDYIFPKLLNRHKNQINMDPNSPAIYHIQLHETYMYLFFKNLKFSSSKQILVNEIKGIVFSLVELSNFSLDDSIDCDGFFDILKYSPLPFVFIPNARIINIKNFCKGIFTFRHGVQKGILMDMKSAVSVGVDFIGAEFLYDENVKIFYVGFIYDEAL